MKNNNFLLCKFVLTIIVSIFTVFFLSTKPALAYPTTYSDACCRAGIEQNFCTAGTGDEWEYFTTEAECNSWAQTLNTYGYTCNPGEGSVGGSCTQDGDRIRCRGGISQQVLNPSLCGAQAVPTPTPYTPAPTPTPTLYYNPTPTPYYPPVYPTYPAPTPSYPSYNPTCEMTATAYGSSITAYIYAQNAQYPVTYHFNFNDGSGDLSSQLATMSRSYSILGYYSVTGYVTDGSGRSSPRCSSQQVYVPGSNIYPTPSINIPYPTPFPIYPTLPPVIIPQPQQPQVIVYGSNSSANASANATTGPIFVTAGNQAKPAVSQLPQTGLPESAWLLSGLLPLGAGLRRFGQGFKAEGSLARFFWQKREYDREG